MGKVLPSQRLLKQFEERLVFGEMNLSEIVWSGAQMMLQYALEREVTEALGRNYYENAPATTKEKGRRNGYESHRVLTGEGAVTVQVPQVRETEKVFQSKILDAYVSRTEKLDELIARMYVHGMSTRDIEATFADVLSGTGVSKSVVSRVTRCLSEDFEAFRKRDLSNEKLLYLELDGTYLRYHQGAERKEPILVATGYRADGTRVLLHIGVGNRESYENWKGFLQEMVARGMREPLPLCPKTQTHSRPARRDVSGPTAKQHRRQVTRALSAPGPERASPLRRGSPASILDPSGGLFSDAARPCQRAYSLIWRKLGTRKSRLDTNSKQRKHPFAFSNGSRGGCLSRRIGAAWTPTLPSRRRCQPLERPRRSRLGRCGLALGRPARWSRGRSCRAFGRCPGTR